jgi:hypothetical protein
LEKVQWPEKILNRKLIAVEGKDDVGFFVKLLDEIGVTNFFVWGIDGKGNFNRDLPLLSKVPGFASLTHFAVIRDGDTDEAFASVRSILCQKMGFQNVPSTHGEFAIGTPKIGIFIMPGKSVKGNTLEDLCLGTVEEHPSMQCVNEFVSCISALKDRPKNMSKTKVQVFLASQPEIVNSIGLGASKNYWDFTSPVLDELKTFLINLK